MENNSYYSYSNASEISHRAYNALIGACVLWGLGINFILCKYCVDFAQSINPIALLIGYLVLAFTGITMSRKSDNAIISFIGYNLVVIPVGVVLAATLWVYGGIDSTIVQNAFLCTLAITALMVAAGFFFPQYFEKLGPILGISLGAIILVRFIFIFIPVNITWVSWISAFIFSMYIGYDISKAQKLSHTADNAVDSAVALYLDIINLLLDLLRIFSNSDD